MKIALYIEDGLEQIVLTPQGDTERSILSKMRDGTRRLEIRTGGFYECQGGYVRQRDSDMSTLIVLRPREGQRDD